MTSQPRKWIKPRILEAYLDHPLNVVIALYCLYASMCASENEKTVALIFIGLSFLLNGCCVSKSNPLSVIFEKPNELEP